MTRRHIILAGDSVFDNDGYVPGEPGLIEQMRQSIPPDWSCTKVAVDGDCIAHVKDQIENLPTNATDLVVSVGGNDVRHYSGLLSSVSEAENLIELLRQPLIDFRAAYDEMLSLLEETRLRTHVCTIYTAIPFEDAVWRQFAPLAIGKFNEVIADAANLRQIRCFRLDTVCVEIGDFSSVSPIEPSCQGGQKIVEAIISGLDRPSTL